MFSLALSPVDVLLLQEKSNSANSSKMITFKKKLTLRDM